MARIPLLQLSDISLTFGGNPLFDGLDLVVHPGDRIALVGRNGSGKSTLMKIMAAKTEPDQGSRVISPGVSVGYMEQNPDLSGYSTLREFAVSGLDEGYDYLVERIAEGLKMQLDTQISDASGGERRRAALAKLLAEAPELMLLDEPTNHLDVQAIEWLESELSTTRAGFILISHDRRFLENLTRATLWVDRSQVRRQEQGFAEFETWRDKIWEEEDQERHKLNRKIKAEARWAVEGISARRKRNQGRLRALRDLKQTRSDQIKRAGTAEMALQSGEKSGRKVIEAKGISKCFGERTILKPFDLRVMRGETIGLVGPNGAGKTTLLKMITGQLSPDQGHVSIGSGVEMAVFDQNRSALDQKASLWDNLTSDPDMAISGKSDQIMVRGTPKHVVGYLKDFLFSEAQARAPVHSLSGGEQARLIMARIMARESNLLVLDEPTNDLDIETLDLLQEVIASFEGTVLVVSHDRDFLDRVCQRVIAMEGDGNATIYPGGWSDYRDQRVQINAPLDEKKPKKKSEPSKNAAAKAPPNGLSFTEKHRLEALPQEMDRLSAEIAKLEEFLMDPELFHKEPVKFKKASEGLAERQQLLAAAEEEWLILEEKAEESLA